MKIIQAYFSVPIAFAILPHHPFSIARELRIDKLVDKCM